jgi:hypothetical protein
LILSALVDISSVLLPQGMKILILRLVSLSYKADKYGHGWFALQIYLKNSLNKTTEALKPVGCGKF